MLLFKILIAPVLIAAVSLAGRKWGAGISGWLLGLPLSSGPVLAFLAVEQGRQFAATAAAGSMLGIVAWAAFTLVYAWCCLKLSWWWSTLLGWVAYSVLAVLLLPVRLGVVWLFLLVSLVLAVMLLLFPEEPQATSIAPHSRYDLPLRMATASVMVVTLTGVAHLLGPIASGILTAFPAYTTILAVFSHRQHPAVAIHVMKGVVAGLYTAATFFLVLSLCLVRLGSAASFSFALTACLVVQAGSLLFVKRRQSAP